VRQLALRYFEPYLDLREGMRHNILVGRNPKLGKDVPLVRDVVDHVGIVIGVKRTARLDWEDVRYFVALARHGTLSATARALRVNHATVARRIASLEALIGRALFDRRARGYLLTAEGKAVLKEASAMDEAALSVVRRLDAGTELSGLVR